jgi:hypothetical protein
VSDYVFKRFVDKQLLDEVTVQATTVDEAVIKVRDQYTQDANTVFVLHKW